MYLIIDVLIQKIALVEISKLEIKIIKPMNLIIYLFVVLFTFAISKLLLDRVHINVSFSGGNISSK